MSGLSTLEGFRAKVRCGSQGIQPLGQSSVCFLNINNNRGQNGDPKVVYGVKLKQYIKAAAEVTFHVHFRYARPSHDEAFVRIANGFVSCVHL